MSTRTNKIILVVGNRGTGKTDFCKNILDTLPQPKKLILDTFDNPAWRNMKTWNHPEWESRVIPIMPIEDIERHRSGMYRIAESDTIHSQDMIDKHCMDTGLIMEDASRYFPLNLSRSQKNYLLNSKQKNTDIILVFHYLATVPPELVKMADYITLFKTGEGDFNDKKYFHTGFREAFEYLKKAKNRFENVTINLQ